MEELYDAAKKILAEQIDIDCEQISPDTRFADLNVEFPEEELNNYSTFSKLITALYNHMELVKNE